LAARLTLVSHAATEAQRRAAFPLDEVLLPQEIAKIKALGWNSPRTQQVLSGPERRAQQTAEALGLSAVIAPGIRDCNYGEWSGHALSEVEASHPEELFAWLTDPGAAPHGGESMLALIDRMERWMEAQRDGGHTLAITHPVVIRAAIVHALQATASTIWRIDIAPLSLTDLRWNGRVWTARSIGCTLERGGDQH
jgi:broad specificity phosphatase PhoE